MILSSQQMQRIVEELEHTIHRNINIMDTEGCIIASTDAERIGTIHHAAFTLLDNNLHQLDITYDGEYDGAKQGVNLPITFRGRTIGVVGITGNPESVRDLGNIIKKMTEISIEDAYQKEQSQLFDNARSTFLYRWLMDEQLDDAALEQMEFGGNILGIDIKLPRIAAVLEPCLKGSMSQDVIFTQELQLGLKAIVSETLASSPVNLFLTIGNRILLLCNSRNSNAITILCKQISSGFSQQYHLPLAVGIGTCGTGREGIIRSFHEAKRACFLSLNTRNNEIKRFTNSDFLLLFKDLDDKAKVQYIQHIFSKCSWEELPHWMLMLRVFFDADGSIQKISNQLYIHKNTIQYRLNKLKQLTGYDPRVYKDSFSLYAALVLYESITDNNL